MRSTRPAGTRTRLVWVFLASGLFALPWLAEPPFAEAAWEPLKIKVTVLSQKPLRVRVVDPVWWEIKG